MNEKQEDIFLNQEKSIAYVRRGLNMKNKITLLLLLLEKIDLIQGIRWPCFLLMAGRSQVW